MMRKCLISLLMALLLSGCGGGFSLTDEQLNHNLPNDFKNRTFVNIKGSEFYRRELDDLAGRILVCTSVNNEPRTEECTVTLSRIIREGTTPTIKLIEDGTVYTSKVDQKASIKGSYLLVTAEFSANQVAEITITDTSYIYIRSTEAPLDELRAYVRDSPGNSAQKRYWIQGVQVATIALKNYIKLEGGVDGTVGPVTGINGSMYRADDKVAYDYGISFVMADIDRDIPPFGPLPTTTPPVGTVSPASPPENPEMFIAPQRELVIESIEGLEQLRNADLP